MLVEQVLALVQALHAGVWPIRFLGSTTNPSQTRMLDFGTWTAFFDNFTAEIGPDNLFCDNFRHRAVCQWLRTIEADGGHWHRSG